MNTDPIVRLTQPYEPEPSRNWAMDDPGTIHGRPYKNGRSVQKHTDISDNHIA